MPSNKYKIFDRMLEGVQIITPAWEYAYVNDAVAFQSQLPKEDLLGKTMMQCFPGIERSEMFLTLKKCMTEQTWHYMVNEFTFPNGDKGYFELRMHPVPEGILIMSFDVTQQKVAEQTLRDHNTLLDKIVKERTEELIVKNSELEQFAYIASHDLQEPLRTAGNYLKLLEEDYGHLLDSAGHQFLNVLHQSVGRMHKLTKSLLDYSRLGLVQSPTKVNLAMLVKEVIDDLEDVIKRTDTIITFGDLPTLTIYEAEIRQLFQNLITNAIKFKRKEEAPKIAINAKEEGAYWKFFITDNGIGIAENHYERIFQIFQKLHLQEEYEGCGIGLANCKKIVELHKGEIYVQSTIGKGSTFTFTLLNI